jgi:hypothetical protein
MMCIYKELDDGQSRKERRLSVIFIRSLFCVLDILTLKVGPIGCLKTSVINYHCITSHKRAHLAWQFGIAGLGLACVVRFRVIQFSALYTNLKQPYIFKCQIWGNRSFFCVSVNTICYKVLTNILHRWVVPYAEEILEDHQCGFRKDEQLLVIYVKMYSWKILRA